MIYLILSIVFSVALLVNFRLFPRFGINTTHAIALNYTVCFLTGLALMPENQSFELDLQANWVWYCLALGVGFIVTFLLSGVATQQAGLTATSLATNISLVIPVLASLFIFKTTTGFTWLNYVGLLLAFVALWLVNLKSDGHATPKKGVGVLIAVFVLYGITNTAINFLNLRFIPNPDRTIPVTLLMVLGAVIAGYLLLIYRLAVKQERFEAKTLLASITLGIPNFLSFYFLLRTLSAFQNSGAFVYPVYNIGVILVATAIGLVFFKEKLTAINWLGLGIAVVAILLISYQSLFGASGL